MTIWMLSVVGKCVQRRYYVRCEDGKGLRELVGGVNRYVGGCVGVWMRGCVYAWMCGG